MVATPYAFDGATGGVAVAADHGVSPREARVGGMLLPYKSAAEDLAPGILGTQYAAWPHGSASAWTYKGV
jgi:hypothetical protein